MNATATAKATRQFRSLAKNYYNALQRIEAQKKTIEALKKENEALRRENEAISQFNDNISGLFWELNKRYGYVVEAVYNFIYNRVYDQYDDRGDVDDLTREAGISELEKRNIDRNLEFANNEVFVLEHLKYL